jgi:hypothetical protein
LVAHVVFYDFVHHDCAGDTVVGHSGEEVTCRLMDRLAAFGVERHARIVVMAQPQQASSSGSAMDEGIAKRVIACAAARGLLTFDLFPVLAGVQAEEQAALFSGHMTAEGNAFVARELAAFLRAEHRDARCVATPSPGE